MLNNNQCMTAALDIMCVLCSDLQVESPERVKEGDSVRLTCKSSCALTDRETFIWYRNSQPLTERRDGNNQLLLQSVRREDAGRYSCAVLDTLTPLLLFISMSRVSIFYTYFCIHFSLLLIKKSINQVCIEIRTMEVNRAV